MPGETILVVEDEPPIRQLIAAALRREGFDVIETRNGVEALEQFCAHAADVALVITDMRLPYMTGEELVPRLRQQRPSLKIICISGYGRNVPAEWHCGFVEKPFTRDQLLTEVRHTLAAK